MPSNLALLEDIGELRANDSRGHGVYSGITGNKMCDG
jgi:hypothetical protein